MLDSINGFDPKLDKYDKYLDNILNNILNENNDCILTEGTLSTKLTGAKYPIWLDPEGKKRNVQHKLARVKVQIGDQRYPVIIEGRIRIADSIDVSNKIKRQIESCFDAIETNKRVFLYYWEHPEADFKYIKSQVKNVKNLGKEDNNGNVFI